MKRGYEICLDANISGSPYPEITWYWNNQSIHPEPLRKRPEKPLKKKVEKKEEVKEEVKKEEEVKEGEVKEEEVKEEGAAEKKEVKEDEEKKESEVKKEEDAVEAEEPDYPTINERLTIDNRHKGVSSIVIRDSVRRDHGVYMVKVENDHGVASAVCEVNVLGLCFYHSHISRCRASGVNALKLQPDHFFCLQTRPDLQ